MIGPTRPASSLVKGCSRSTLDKSCDLFPGSGCHPRYRSGHSGTLLEFSITYAWSYDSSIGRRAAQSAVRHPSASASNILRPPWRERLDAVPPKKQCINSIDRGLLSEELIGEVERASIAIFFEHKLQTANFDGKKLKFATPSGQQATTEVEVDFDFCVGADGSHSNVRRQLMRVLRYAISHSIP
jgi:hypothetical protein